MLSVCSWRKQPHSHTSIPPYRSGTMASPRPPERRSVEWFLPWGWKKERKRLILRILPFSQHAVNVWNDVPEDMFTTPTAWAFKNLLEAHCKSLQSSSYNPHRSSLYLIILCCLQRKGLGWDMMKLGGSGYLRFPSTNMGFNEKCLKHRMWLC